MPVVALVFSGLGFCLPPLLVVGIILGVIALAQSKGSRGLAIAAVCLPLAVIPFLGIVAAISIPNFIRFQARAKQSEAKSNLKGAYTSEKAWFGEKDRFDIHPAVVGFVPERGNRYLYLFSANGPVEPNTRAPRPDAVGIGLDTRRHPQQSNEGAREAIPAGLAESLGISGNCPDCGITIVAAGNIDNDETIDIWSISTRDRPGAKAGVLVNDVNDVEE